MKIKGITWLGTRTAQFQAMFDFCQDVLGLSPRLEEPDFAVMDLPDGASFELFGPKSQYNPWMTHPVAGFLVEDIAAARREMKAHGVEFIGPIHTGEDGYVWSHFRAPDGFVYELTCNPAHP